MITVEVRTGNRARCLPCKQDIIRGELRVVVSLDGSYQPHHYHIECIRAHVGRMRDALNCLEEVCLRFA